MGNQLLCPNLFEEINDSLGKSLKILDSDKTVIGRDFELNMLEVILNKMERPVGFYMGVKEQVNLFWLEHI